MKTKTDFCFCPVEYSKKISECNSGEIVAKGETRYLLMRAPDLAEKEKELFCEVLQEIKQSRTEILGKKDVYFFLKNYCLENMILLNKEQREKILLLLEWESIQESILTPLIKDPEFEEIVINGPRKPVMVYHRIFGWLTTNAQFESEDRIRTVINRLASPLGRQLTYHTPLLNAVLADGSRLNACMNPVAFSGINATIRKFKENPLTPVDLVDYGTISREAMAFLWMAMQTSCSILICGNTGSGKTTTLNALFCFLPREERIVAAEETPELVLPQNHTIKLNTAEQVNVTLGKLIENTFRMRPDRVIVGEIRTKHEAGAFINTMLAGQAKGSYATFHAESGEEAVQRMESFGIDKRTMASLDLIVVQKRLSIIEENSRKEIRKVTEISEIAKTSNGIKLEKLFEYNFEKKRLERVKKSKRVTQKICRAYSKNEEEIEKETAKKEALLEKLKGIAGFGEFYELAEREK